MMNLTILINNTSYGNSSLYDYLNENPSAIKFMVLNYYNDDNYETIEYQGDILNPTIDGDPLVGSQLKVVFSFNETDFKKAIGNFYATYVITQKDTDNNSNKIFIIPTEPENHNYIYTSRKEEYSFYLITEEYMQDPIVNKANGILVNWSNVGALAPAITMKDQHTKIIIENRKIIIPSENKNILITKDNESEEITFIIPRYYDGVDLSSKKLSIYYIRPNANKNEQIRSIKEDLNIDNSTLNETTFNATWVVSDIVTNVPGTLTFAIIAEGDGVVDDYFWQTYPSQLQIEEGIYGKIPTDESTFSFVETDVSKENIFNKVHNLETSFNSGEIKWQSLHNLLKEKNLIN